MKKIGRILFTIVAIVMILFAVLVITAGVANQQKLSQFRDKGITVSGRVTHKQLIKSEPYPIYQIEVAYLKQTGEKLNTIFEVDENDFRNAHINQEISITYVPGKPEWVVIGTEYGYDRRPLYMGIAAFILGVLVLFFIIAPYRMVKKRYKKPA